MRPQDEVRPSLMEIQARHCFETLKKVLAEAGSSIDRVLKADVHLVEPANFYEFELRVERAFSRPSRPRARPSKSATRSPSTARG